MAERVAEGSPESAFVERPVKQATYDFNSWLNGEEWKLTKGVDFELEPERFRVYLQNQAAKRGIKAATRVRGDCVHVKAVARRNGLYVVPLGQEISG